MIFVIQGKVKELETAIQWRLTLGDENMDQ
jgi:hypothetical protein